MSKANRDRGKRGEKAARELLADRDWVILANTADGSKVEDMIVNSPDGKIYSVEVKNTKQINIPAVLKQSRENASKKKLDWMIMCKIDQSSSWLIWMKYEQPKVWNK